MSVFTVSDHLKRTQLHLKQKKAKIAARIDGAPIMVRKTASPYKYS